MRKIVLAYSLIICVSLMSVSSVNFFVRDAYAIPNSDVPAPDGHPHSCGIPGHPQFIDGTVTWANASANWQNGILQNPDGACHQHRSNRDFGAFLDRREPYTASKVWDNRNYRVDLVGNFDLGHGFINEFPDIGGGPALIPKYYFNATQTDGKTPCNWNANAQDMITVAFDMWSAVQSDRSYLVTGIAFELTTDPAQADITIYWQPHNALGEWNPNTRQLTFASNISWYFPLDPAGTPANEYHFLSTALHETGHVAGLGDQNDIDDVMIFERGPGPNGSCFSRIDTDSIEGIRDLYSIPAPDFGDAEPWMYPVLKANNGARNLFIGREWLGKNPIGQTTTTWEWDARIVDLDIPDDGCFFRLPPPRVGGIGFAFVTVSVTNWQSSRYNNTFGYELYLAIWIDWDWMGGWNHPAEMVVFDRLRPSTWGGNTSSWVYSFPVPNGWCAPTWGRARLVYANTGMNLFPSGLIPNFQSPDNGGEVEDYFLPMYDIAITNVSPSKTVVGQGFSININVIAANQGDYTETFNVTVYANTTIIATLLTNITLTSGNSTTITFTWNTTGFAKGYYTISAYAWPVQGETHTTDNNCTGGTVLVNVAGDVSGSTQGVPDGIVNILDINYLVRLFMTRPKSPNWNPNADINNDLVINILDVYIPVQNFLKKWP